MKKKTATNKTNKQTKTNEQQQKVELGMKIGNIVIDVIVACDSVAPSWLRIWFRWLLDACYWPLNEAKHPPCTPLLVFLCPRLASSTPRLRPCLIACFLLHFNVKVSIDISGVSWRAGAREVSRSRYEEGSQDKKTNYRGIERLTEEKKRGKGHGGRERERELHIAIIDPTHGFRIQPTLKEDEGRRKLPRIRVPLTKTRSKAVARSGSRGSRFSRPAVCQCRQRHTPSWQKKELSFLLFHTASRNQWRRGYWRFVAQINMTDVKILVFITIAPFSEEPYLFMVPSFEIAHVAL